MQTRLVLSQTSPDFDSKEVKSFFHGITVLGNIIRPVETETQSKKDDLPLKDRKSRNHGTSQRIMISGVNKQTEAGGLCGDTLTLALLVSTLAGLATGLGSLPAVLIRKAASQRALDLMLGFAAGVMLAATSFSLVAPALTQSSPLTVGIGILLGALFVHTLDSVVPHIHPLMGKEGPSFPLARNWLLMLAITIHNIPEGLSIGVVFGSGEVSAGVALVIAMGLHNIPEGLALAVSFLREGYSRGQALTYATLSGLAEPVACLIGVLTVRAVHAILPLALAFAGGAMLYVVSDEMIPESHRAGHEKEATLGLIVGFIIMMVLETVFS